jgi:hypothetical protein
MKRKSGAHRSPRRLLSASAEQWQSFDALARSDGHRTWSAWVRKLMLRELERADIRQRIAADIRKRTRRTA